MLSAQDQTPKQEIILAISSKESSWRFVRYFSVTVSPYCNVFFVIPNLATDCVWHWPQLLVAAPTEMKAKWVEISYWQWSKQVHVKPAWSQQCKLNLALHYYDWEVHERSWFVLVDQDEKHLTSRKDRRRFLKAVTLGFFFFIEKHQVKEVWMLYWEVFIYCAKERWPRFSWWVWYSL